MPLFAVRVQSGTDGFDPFFQGLKNDYDLPIAARRHCARILYASRLKLVVCFFGGRNMQTRVCEGSCKNVALHLTRVN